MTQVADNRYYIAAMEDGTAHVSHCKPKDSLRFLCLSYERGYKFSDFFYEQAGTNMEFCGFHNVQMMYNRWVTEEMNGDEGDDVYYVPPVATRIESVPAEQILPQEQMVSIPKHLYDRLVYLGIIGADGVRGHNVGKSDYSKHLIQPWSIWRDYDLDPWSADIVKRILRHKEGESRITDLEKIKHICDELIRQEKYVKQE